MITVYAKQKKRHRCTEQTFRFCGRRQVWDVLREQHGMPLYRFSSIPLNINVESSVSLPKRNYAQRILIFCDFLKIRYQVKLKLERGIQLQFNAICYLHTHTHTHRFLHLTSSVTESDCLAAHGSKANEEARLVERKLIYYGCWQLHGEGRFLSKG